MPDAAPSSEATASATASATDLIYGGYALQRGDLDSDPFNKSAPRWGGQDGAGPYDKLDAIEHPFELVVRLNATSTITFPSYVRELQWDLRTLGFGAIRAETGQFGRHTEQAVREFQIYAGMEQVACETVPTEEHPPPYLERLSAVRNTMRYDGPISGVVNEATRRRLKHWIDQAWRCPVVIQARTGEGYADVYDGGDMADGASAENLWRYDDLRSAAPRVFARDFTGYYDFAGTGHDSDEMVVLGDRLTFVVPTGSWAGPRSAPPLHTWDGGEITPERLIGTPADELSDAQQSTFRVIRAVSESECLGFFDSVNSYDNAFVSMGPCHWTLAIMSQRGLLKGELCGYLAYLRRADEEAFEEAVGRFGARVSEEWKQDGSAFFNRSQRKYTGWMSLQQEGGSYEEMTEEEEAYNYFKSWHWFYRFVMAARTVEGFRRGMWDMARVRLRDILSTSWGSSAPSEWLDGTPVGEVFTSEKAAAMILRWHVRYPGHMVRKGAGRRLQNAFERARQASLPPSAVSWEVHPSGWTNAHEAALMQGLIDEVAQAGSDNLQGDIQGDLNEWPAWRGGDNPRGFELSVLIDPLSEARDSFELATDGLPPAPLSAP